MHTRAQALIDELRLAPHPEGGYFREIYRSSSRVAPDDGRSERPAITSIYFLLVDGGYSRWHRVRSDEIWHFYEGEGLELFLAPPSVERVTSARLAPHRDGSRPVQIAPAGWWQAARTRGAYTLVGCTVAPGFQYSDFTFLRDVPEARARLQRLEQTWLEFM